MGVGILIGYFSKQEEARKALLKLTRQGFSRSAMVHKDMDGGVHSTDPFLWRRAFGVTLAACLFGGGAGLTALFLNWSKSLPAWNSSTSLALILAGASIGALAGLLWLQRSKYGVEARVMRDHARWLMSGESVLILQAPVGSLQLPVAMLRESSDTPPALFVMHPKRERRVEVREPEVKLSPAQFIEHAQRHAREQQVDPRVQRSAELLKRLKHSRQ